MLAGCASPPADIPGGCYILEDGKPLMEVGNGGIQLLIEAEVESAAIGPWLDSAKERFEISPGFYLHDNAASDPAGPSVMVRPNATRGAGSLTFRQNGGRDIIMVPVEAYGFREAVRSEDC